MARLGNILKGMTGYGQIWKYLATIGMILQYLSRFGENGKEFSGLGNVWKGRAKFYNVRRNFTGIRLAKFQMILNDVAGLKRRAAIWQDLTRMWLYSTRFDTYGLLRHGMAGFGKI